MTSRNVLIVLPYVNHYRVPLLGSLRARLSRCGISLSVASARPSGRDAGRADASSFTGPRLSQLSLKIGRKHILLRSLPKGWLSSDLVVIEHAAKNLESYVILALRRATGRRTALWGHGTTITEPRSRATAAAQKWMIGMADWYFAYTKGSAYRAVSEGMHRDHITVLNNTTDTAELIEQMSYFGRDRRDPCTFLYVGGIDSSKRIDRLLAVGARVHSVDSRFKLIIGGRGADEHLLTRASVPWLDYRGVMDSAQKAHAASEASAMVIAGRVGLAVVDAFAMGLPVITTEWEFHAPEFEYLSDDNAIVAADSESELAAAVLKFMRSRSLRTKLTAGSRRSARGLTVEDMADSFEKGILDALR